MERSGRKLITLVVLCCSTASAAAHAESLNRQELLIHAEIAGEPCKFVDPSDPHQIVGPHPAHGDCLTALYPATIPTATFIGDSSPIGGAESAAAVQSTPVSLTSLWLAVAVAMLVLAGINSRKRHRQLPSPGMGGIYGHPGEHLHKHSEGSRWNED